MTSYEPQVGDIVDIRGTVTYVYGDGGFDTEHNSVVHDQKVTLVERPEPKITFELTALQAANLATIAEWNSSSGATREAARIIWEALDGRS